MSEWEHVLNKFLNNYKDEEYVIGIVLSGSYATGNCTSKSDIDIHIITDEINWKERGNVIIDGIMIEYFINPISELYKYMEDDYLRRKRLSTASMFGNGKILIDKTGKIKKLKEDSLKYYEKDFNKPDEITIMCNNYSCWDLYDELKDKIENKENYEMNYYLLVKELIDNYYYKNNIATIPITKLEKIYRNIDYRNKYHLKNIPNEYFLNLVLDCFDKKNMQSIDRLYNYVIEDFKITEFKLRTEMNNN